MVIITRYIPRITCGHRYPLNNCIHRCNVFRFKTNLAKEAIQETLLKYLKDKEYSQIQAEVLSKTIASELKDRLKGIVYFH